MKRLLATITAAVGIAMGVLADPVDLAKLEYSTRMGDGIILTGELKKNVQISIMDGATVTLRDVTIHGVNDGKYKWAGITCEGDATLVLEGGNVVTGFYKDYPGIYVPTNKTLTIKGPGTLSAGPGRGGAAAAIGAGVGLDSGNIVIESGNIYAQAYFCAAGIGAAGYSPASYGVCGNITIAGGTVTAKGGQNTALYGGGAGIGGSYVGYCGYITIIGGYVHAEAGYNAAGIGASGLMGGFPIEISGGTVEAKGNGSGAGIGGANRTVPSITISGGRVRATGGAQGDGIGRVYEGTGITIGKDVESVIAMSGVDGGIPICSTSPDVTVAKGLSDVTSGRTRIIGKTVDIGYLWFDTTIPDGATLTGVLDTISKISIADGATVTLRNVSIKGEARDNYKWAGLTCLGNATIVLDGHNVIYGYQDCYPGIYVPKGSTVTIQGTGSLHVIGSNKAAGIGGGEGLDCGNIVIRGGSVHAGGGDGAAGIGGGKNASCGNISIRTGIKSVRAVPGDVGSTAIGAGTGGTCGDVFVEDGLGDETDAKGIRDIWPTTTPLRHLDRIASNTTFKNGDILTGTLTGNTKRFKLTIADGATVTLSDAQIIGIDTNTCRWAGLTCAGDATIILEGENGVQGFYENYPGIYVPQGKTLTIKGEGSLLARSSIYNDPEAYYGAAGIGGIFGKSSGNLVIEGGTIEAVGGGHSAGIGNACGYSATYCTNGYISILGGTVIARGGLKASGIGCGGGRSFCGDITIGPDAVSVTAIAGEGAPPIGKGFSSASVCGTITVAEGLSDVTDGLTRTIRSGDLSKLTGDTVFGDGETLKGTLAGRYKVSIADGATVTLQDVVINGRKSTDSRWKWAGLTCEGDATIILAGDNTVKGFDYGYPGIYVPAGKTLTIKGTGSLAASSNDGAAGIGGGINDCGNIVIEGGSIEATGSGAPGIGGGDSCGDITILGGSVKAKGSNAAGIGSDSEGECGTITISSNGGIAPVVEAVGGSTASGIGGAEGGYCGNIRIESGYVVATGGKFGSGIGGTMKDGCTVEITGGTVVAAGGKNAPGIGHDGIWSPCGTITIGSGIDQVTATAGEGASPIAGWGTLYGAETEPVLAPGLERSTEGVTCTIAPAATASVVFDSVGGRFSNGAATKTVEATPGNLWGKLPMPSKSGQVFDGWYTAASGGEIVTASSEVPAGSATYYAHWTPRLGLAAASEWPNEFQTDSWCGQGTVSHDGRDALRSGIIYDNQGSYLITKVSGPGILSFWWAVSCEAGGKDALRLLVDGAQVAMISGEVDWKKVEVEIPGAGTHTVKWNYTKNGSVTKGEDFGWIDQISWSAASTETAFVFDANGGKFSNGATVKKTDATPGNLWGKMYMPARDGQVFVGWYTAKEGGTLVTSSSVVPDYYATYYARWTPRLGLAAASEWPNEFQTDSWCGQGAVSHDGKDALRSGIIYDGQSSYLITRVTGPGTLTFWWKVSCEAGGNDALRFLLDGSQKCSISGEKDWAKVTVDVAGSGSHVLKWNYTKNGSVSKGQDFGWIDQIQWTAK